MGPFVFLAHFRYFRYFESMINFEKKEMRIVKEILVNLGLSK